MNQHPKEYVKPTDRFAVFIEIRKGVMEPLSYGIDGQPAPNELLRRGYRAASFATEEDARAAIKACVEKWDADGVTFHIGKRVQFVKLEIA